MYSHVFCILGCSIYIYGIQRTTKKTEKGNEALKLTSAQKDKDILGTLLYVYCYSLAYNYRFGSVCVYMCQER